MAFQSKGFSVEQQLATKLQYNQKSIGRYYLDFLLNGVLVVELKVANDIYPRHIKQVLGYLKAQDLSLGILAAYTRNGVEIKRVINSKIETVQSVESANL